MRYPVIIAALFAALALFTIPSTTTVSAAPPPGCEDLNSPPPNWLLENGVESCLAANALVNAEAACIAKLQEQLDIPYLAGSPAWFAQQSADGIMISNFCPQSDEIRFGLSPCSDWMTNGPGTGPGVNPESDIEQCKAWAYEAFHYGAFTGPVSQGQPGRCEGLRGFECVAALTAAAEVSNLRPVPVVPPSVTFSPPDAGSGGLLAGHGVGAYVAGLVGLALVYSAIPLAVALRRRLPW